MKTTHFLYGGSSGLWEATEKKLRNFSRELAAGCRSLLEKTVQRWEAGVLDILA